MALAPSSLPALQGPRIKAVRIAKSIKLGHLRQMVQQLGSEKGEYYHSMEMLLHNIEDVNRENELLQEGIRQGLRMRDGLTKDLAQAVKDLKHELERRHRAARALRHCQAQRRTVKGFDSPDQIREEMDRVSKEFAEMQKERDGVADEKQNEMDAVRRAVAMRQLLGRLLDMNTQFGELAHKVTKELGEKQGDLSHAEKKMVAVAKKKLERSEQIRKLLTLGLPNIPIDVSIEPAGKVYDHLLGYDPVNEHFNSEVEKGLNPDSVVYDDSVSELTPRPQTVSTVREPDDISRSEQALESRPQSSNSVRLSLLRKRLVKKPGVDDSHTVKIRTDDGNVSENAASEKVTPRTSASESETKTEETEVIETESELQKESDDSEFDSEGLIKKMEVGQDPVDEVDVVEILLKDFGYPSKIPEIDEANVKIKKHRQQKGLKKRRQRIEYEEEVDPSGIVDLLRKDKEYEIVKEESEGGTLHKYKIPMPYEYFDLESEGGVHKCRRLKEFEYSEDESDGGTHYIIKSQKQYVYEPCVDAEGGKCWRRRQFFSDEYDYDEIEEENGESQVLKTKKEFEYVDVVSDGGTKRKVRRPIRDDDYEYDEMEGDDGERLIVKRKKDFEFYEGESEGGTRKVIRKEIVPEFYEYEEVDDEDGPKIEKRQIEFEFADLSSEGGTVRKVKVMKENPNDFEYREVELPDKSKQIVKQKCPLEWVDIESDGGTKRRVKRKIKEDEFDYEEGANEETGEPEIVKVPKQFEVFELEHDGNKFTVKREVIPADKKYLHTWTMDDDEEYRVVRRRKKFETADVDGKPVRRYIKRDEQQVLSRIDDDKSRKRETIPLLYKQEEMESEGGTMHKVDWPVDVEETYNIEEIDAEGKSVITTKKCVFTCEWDKEEGEPKLVLHQEIFPDAFEYEEIEEDDGDKVIVRRKLDYECRELEDGKKAWMIKRPEETEFELVAEEENCVRKIRKVPREFEYVDVECDDGKVRKVRRVVHRPVFEWVELVDDDGNKTIVEREKVYEDVIMESEGGTRRQVRLRVMDDKYEYEECVDEATGETSLKKRKRKYEMVEIESEGGTKKTVRREIVPDEYEYEEVQDEDGGKHIERKKKIFRHREEDGKRIKYQVRGQEKEYVRELDSNGEWVIVERDVKHELVETSDGEGGTHTVRRRQQPKEYMFVERIGEDGERTIEKVPITFTYMDIETPEKLYKNVRVPKFDDEYEYVQEIDENGEPVIAKRKKEFQYEWRVDPSGEKMLVRKQVEQDEYEYVEVEDEDGEKKIEKRKIEYEYKTIGEGDDAKRVKVIKRDDAEEFEYVEVEDEDGNKEIVKRKKEFEYVDVKSDGGTTKRVRRPVERPEYEFVEVIDENGEKKLEKRQKQFKPATVESEGGTKRKVKQLVPQNEYEYEEIIDPETGEKTLEKKKLAYRWSDASSEGGTKHRAKKLLDPHEYEYELVFDEEAGEKKIERKRKLFKREREDGRLIKRQIHDEDEFEYEMDGDGKITKRKREFEMTKMTDPDGKEKLVRREINPNEYEYVEMTDDETGDKKLVKKRRPYTWIDHLSEGGTQRRVKQYLEPEEFEYVEVSDEETGAKKIEKQQKKFEVSLEDGKRIRRQIRDDEYEYDVDDNNNETKRRRQFETVKMTDPDGKERLLRREVVPDDYEYIEVSDGDGGKEIKKRKIRYGHRNEPKEDGGHRRIRFRLHDDDDYEYVMEEQPDGTKSLKKQRKQFVYSDRESEGGTRRRVKRPVTEYEYVEDVDEEGNPIIVKKPKEYQTVDVEKEDGTKVKARKEVHYNHKEVELEDGTKLLVREAERPKRKVKKVVRKLVAEWPVDENGNIIKEEKHSEAPETAEDAAGNEVGPTENAVSSGKKHGERVSLTAQLSEPLFVLKNVLADESDSGAQSETGAAGETGEEGQGRKRRKGRTRHGDKENQEDGDGKKRKRNQKKKGSKNKNKKKGKGDAKDAEAASNQQKNAQREFDDGEEDYYSYEDLDDAMVVDEDGNFKPLRDNKAFARRLLANAIQKRIERTEMEVKLNDAQFRLEQLRSERQDLNHEYKLAKMQHDAKLASLNLQKDVLTISVAPIAEGSDQTSGYATQTDTSNVDVNSIMQEISECTTLIAQKPILENDAQTLERNLIVCKAKLSAIKEKNEQLKQTGDELAERYQIVRPLDGKRSVHPLTKKRLMLEQEIEAKKTETVEVQQQTKDNSDLIRKLKCKIEDQKCLHDMLKKKIAEEKRAERPNVTALCKNMDTLKKNEKGVKEKLKLLTIEESSIDEFVGNGKAKISDENIAELQKQIAETQARIAEVKAEILDQLKIKERAGRDYQVTSIFEVMNLEKRDKELSAKLSDAARDEESVKARIDQMVKALHTQRLAIPESFITEKRKEPPRRRR